MRRHSSLPWTLDILEAIERIERYLVDQSLESFKASTLIQDAVERNLEKISEASRHIADRFKIRHASIAWQDIASIGNIIRHEYFRVNKEIVWNIAKRDL